MKVRINSGDREIEVADDNAEDIEELCEVALDLWIATEAELRPPVAFGYQASSAVPLPQSRHIDTQPLKVVS